MLAVESGACLSAATILAQPSVVPRAQLSLSEGVAGGKAQAQRRQQGGIPARPDGGGSSSQPAGRGGRRRALARGEQSLGGVSAASCREPPAGGSVFWRPRRPLRSALILTHSRAR
eukprot:scaffold2755_cov333-Prasinococcus_capsulatus_cf.AAC.1